MKRTPREKARIAWRRGQWATVEEFLSGEAQKRKVGPGMHEPEDGTSVATEFDGVKLHVGQVPESPSLDQLERWLR